MKIAIRLNDGYVLNSDMLTPSGPHAAEDTDLVSLYETDNFVFDEDFTIIEIDALPRQEDKRYFYAKYYVINNEIIIDGYAIRPFAARDRINELKKQLAETDYKVAKAYEAYLINTEPEYDMTQVHIERQAMRDEINELEQYLLQND